MFKKCCFWLTNNLQMVPGRQEKEAWIKAKYVEKKFLKKLNSTEILINGERKSERRWSVKKCRRHNSATTVPKMRRRYRQEPGGASPATLSAGTCTDVSLYYHSYLEGSFTCEMWVLCSSVGRVLCP